MSSKNNIVLELSYNFALDTIILCKKMKKRNVDYVLINQLLKSGTSVGANLEESVGGISDKDFLNKLFIAYKEARESRYWINLLYDSKDLTKGEHCIMLPQIQSIIRLLGASIKTIRKTAVN